MDEYTRLECVMTEPLTLGGAGSRRCSQLHHYHRRRRQQQQQWDSNITHPLSQHYWYLVLKPKKAWYQFGVG